MTQSAFTEQPDEIGQLDVISRHLEAALQGIEPLANLVVATGVLRFTFFNFGSRGADQSLIRPTGSIGRFTMLWTLARHVVERFYPEEPITTANLCASVSSLVLMVDQAERFVLSIVNDGSLETWFDDLCLLSNGLDSVHRHIRAHNRSRVREAFALEQCAPAGVLLN